jgi:DNA invertase Pin-like site-specific DNA recombinase
VLACVRYGITPTVAFVTLSVAAAMASGQLLPLDLVCHCYYNRCDMTEQKALQAVGYVRVSTDRQAENGPGLAVQERAIRDYCKRQRFRLTTILRDEGVSGTTDPGARPGLSEALELVRDSGTKVLVVPSLDRLARSLTAQEAALAHVWKVGARVFATDTGEILQDDPEDPMRTAMRQMMGVFAQLERGMINARLRRGRREKAEGGGFAYGAPPYGSRAKDGALVPAAEELEAMTLAYALRHEDPPRSYRAIGSALTKAGHSPRRAKRWHPDVVRRLCERAEQARGGSVGSSSKTGAGRSRGGSDG